MCSQLGIEGKNIKKELTDLLQSLPSMYNEVAQNARNLKEAAAFYQSFVGQMIKNTNEVKCVPVLQYIIGK